MWFKMKHGKTTCDVNRPKDMEEYGFEVPERLRETLVLSGIAPDAALVMAHLPEEEFIDPQTGRLSSSVSLSLTRSFHPWDTQVPAKRDWNTILNPCERLDFTCPD